MGNHHKSRASLVSRGITLNSLKERLYSLNMRMRLAMQNHNEEEQEALRKEMAEVQEEIMGLGGGYRR